MGYDDKMFQTGSCYQDTFEAKKDENKIFILFRKYVKMSYVLGENTGNLYYTNRLRVEYQHRASVYFQKSTEVGCDKGKFEAGRFYKNGITK
ncbi:12771_t:CDS:1, partial [Dentiscutata heterogama]